MADPLLELLEPHFQSDSTNERAGLPIDDTVVSAYLSRLTTLSVSSLTTIEQHALSQSSQSIIRSLQQLTKRSHRSVIAATDHLVSLRESLVNVGRSTGNLQDDLPKLESEASRFAEKYSKTSENAVLDKRKKAMLLARNVDRLSDILDLPTLLATAITSSTTPQAVAGPATQTGASYASALDIHAHIKRINALYPELEIVKSISSQAEQEMKGMTSSLIGSLQTQGLKLAAAIRTIGWLRRVAPELDETFHRQRSVGLGASEGTLGAIFLVCRLSNLITTLEALDPLKELADQETQKRRSNQENAKRGTLGAWSGGQQTEKYLKRYIEIFREQSFSIISMFKSIFPTALPIPGAPTDQDVATGLPSPALRSPSIRGTETVSTPDGLLLPVPSALATFPSHLVDLLVDVLREYLPNVREKASRDSLLTQVLYCAGSLGRLGGDFSMILAVLEDLDDENNDEEEEFEWVEIMKKHRVQASRLELLASGVGTTSRHSHSTVREQAVVQ